MPTNTSRLALAQPIGSDSPAEFRLADTANMPILDNAAIYKSGTLAARASLSALVAGTLYYATDTALLYEYNGTAWQTVMLAGPWVSLTPVSGWDSGQSGFEYPLSARLEGDIVRLRGSAYNNTGTTSPLALTTLPTGMRPTMSGGAPISFAAGWLNGSVRLGIATTGAISISSGIGLPAGVTLDINGITFSVS